MKYRFMYLRNDKGMPVACVAMNYVNHSHESGGAVYYGVSTHHPKDKFNRKLARELALGRLVAHPQIATIFKTTPSAHDISRAVVNDLVQKSVTPTRARVAANKWLKKPVTVYKK